MARSSARIDSGLEALTQATKDHPAATQSADTAAAICDLPVPRRPESTWSFSCPSSRCDVQGRCFGDTAVKS